MTRVRIIGPGRAGSSLATALSRAGWEVLPIARARRRHQRGRRRGRPGAHRHPRPRHRRGGSRASTRRIASSWPTSPDRPGCTPWPATGGELSCTRSSRCPTRSAARSGSSAPGSGSPRTAIRWWPRWWPASGAASCTSPRRSGSATTPRRSSRRTTSSRCSGRPNGWPAASARRSRPSSTSRAGSLADVAALGPRAALTGPVRRGDTATVARHLDALPPEERPAYEVMAREAGRLCP